jgi:hypothetical protein
MSKQGKGRLAWQNGSVVLYAEAIVEVAYEVNKLAAFTKIDCVPEEYRLGVLFGCTLARESARSIAHGRELAITVREFKSQLCDTTTFAAAFATYQAIADAINLDIGSFFSFDESRGRFQISYESTRH